MNPNQVGNGRARGQAGMAQAYNKITGNSRKKNTEKSPQKKATQKRGRALVKLTLTKTSKPTYTWNESTWNATFANEDQEMSSSLLTTTEGSDNSSISAYA